MRLITSPIAGALKPVVLSGLVVLQLSACTVRLVESPDPRLAGAHVVSAEEAARLGSAWALLEGRFPQLRLDDGFAGPGKSVRGRDASGRAPLVVVNGAVTHGFQQLRSIPAREVRSIAVLSAIEASQKFGAFGAGGAILVETHRR